MAKKKYQAKQSEDKLTIEYSREDFETSLPNLAAELKNENIADKASIPIDAVRHPGDEETEVVDDYRPKELYNPGACDFVRRCSTDEEAIEIIDYCLARGELTEEEAEDMKKQLHEKGLESFGPKKTAGYYQRKYLRTTDFTKEEKSKKNTPKLAKKIE